MPSARGPRRHNPPCVLCLASGADRKTASTRGQQVELGATWAAHRSCWGYMLQRARIHRATGLLTEEERVAVCRAQLTRMAPALYRARAARRA